MNKAEFIAKIGPAAQTCMRECNILASLIIAQAALESGWGKHAPGNMLFGVKATKSWTGKTQQLTTTEYINGIPHRVKATFRAYDSWLDSLRDHSKVLLQPRYKAVVGEKDYKKACRAVKAAKYATDPEYAEKLIATIEANKLYEWDKVEEEPTLRKDHANIVVEEFLRTNYKKQQRPSIQKAPSEPCKCCPRSVWTDDL
ncbi:glycoside hydrolase family 73 protein [Erysipelothrix tonsillarum]|uniref:glycoside hydrolase family 73 protein n=1 Tax=Erysipelothrix tonsillarum TaxID=38402 RepID=UPI0039C827CE